MILPQKCSRAITFHRDADPGDALNALLLVGSDELDPNNGGAAHRYRIEQVGTGKPLAEIHYQHGPRNVEGSTPGASDAAVIAVALDRLEGWQAGPLACAENAEAIEHLRAALRLLGERSAARRAQGVIGQLAQHASPEQAT